HSKGREHRIPREPLLAPLTGRNKSDRPRSGRASGVGVLDVHHKAAVCGCNGDIRHAALVVGVLAGWKLPSGRRTLSIDGRGLLAPVAVYRAACAPGANRQNTAAFGY